MARSPSFRTAARRTSPLRALFGRVRWLWVHYPRVPEGRDSFLMRIYDRWKFKTTPGGRSALGAFFLLFVVEMMPGISPTFPLMLVLLFALVAEFLRGGRNLKSCGIRAEKVWTLDLNEEKKFPVSWFRGKASGLAGPELVRVPDGLALEGNPEWDAEAESSGVFLLKGRRRGKWTLDQLRIAQRGGAFLMDRWSAQAEPISVLVKPLPLRVDATAEIRSRVDLFLSEEMGLRTREGSNGEFRNLREYRAGDPVRSIHARSSMRFASPMVRVDEEPVPAGTRATVAVDPTVRNLGQRMAFEAAVALALGLAEAFLARGVATDLVVVGRAGRVAARGASVEAMAEALAELAPLRPARRRPRPRFRAEDAGRFGWLVAVDPDGDLAPEPGWKFLRVARGPAAAPPPGWDSVDSAGWGVPDP